MIIQEFYIHGILETAVLKDLLQNSIIYLITYKIYTDVELNTDKNVSKYQCIFLNRLDSSSIGLINYSRG